MEFTYHGETVKRQKNGIWKVSDSTMLEFICALIDASDYNIEMGYDGIANAQYKLKKQLHDVLESVGYFDDVED